MRLTHILNEGLPKVDNSLMGLFLDNTNMLTQIHIFHILTKSYSEHVAIGEFYESLNGLNDKFIESLIGVGMDTKHDDYDSKLVVNYSRETLVSLVEDYRDKVTENIDKTSKSELAAVNDTIIDIQSSVDTLLYKLQLK